MESWGEPNIPKCRLDAPHVILAPIPTHHLLLADGDARPLDSHARHVIGIVLIEDDLQGRKVALDPRPQPPFLNDLARRLQGDEFARHVATEERKLAARFGAFEHDGRSACECCEALRGCEGRVEFFGGRAEFVGHGERRRVHGRVASCTCGG